MLQNSFHQRGCYRPSQWCLAISATKNLGNDGHCFVAFSSMGEVDKSRLS